MSEPLPASTPLPADQLTGEQQERALVAIKLVRQWLTESDQIKPVKSAKLLAEVLKDPSGLDFTVGFVDGVVRPQDRKVAAHNLARIAPAVPRFLPWYMRAAVRVGGALAPILPGIVVPASRMVFRQMVGHLIVDSRPSKIAAGIASVRQPGVELNVNLLGEAVLGEGEAARRLDGTKELLRRDDIDYVSIKVSSTVAPHSPWAFSEAVDEIVDQLYPLFEIAAQTPEHKFINLDMEEYRDLDLTLAVFTQILDKPEFLDLSAGIVLQTYLPDALAAMIRLQDWSAARRARGGADIKVRVVKGANLPMEVVEAKVHGWPLATWHTKQDSDTNYKRVLEYAFTPERIANVRVGVAGHNLFDIAFSWVLAQERGVTAGIEYEMLLGMAEGQAKAVRETVGSLRLYTPVVSPDQFDVAIAYLVRRLEEGASQENFMSAVFELSANPELFDRECDRFLASLAALELAGADVVPAAHRVADRHAVVPIPEPGRFENTPDTDPTVAQNRDWAMQIIASAAQSNAGIELVESSRVTDPEALQQLLRKAHAGGQAWGQLPASERADVLRNAGAALESNRALLIEVAMSETGKIVEQADPEVSEAVDFAYFYADRAEDLTQIDGARFESADLTLVTPPWNFPLAIPAGSVLAALAAGSGVVFKPAPNANRCGAVIAQILWDAGVPRSALTLIDIGEADLGAQLISDPLVDQVILTGAYETAQLFRSFRTELPLFAETSGKNAIIVTPNADYDLAVKDIVYSAFGHAGQKCSAASLVVLVGSVADSDRFRNQLLDSVRSLNVGSEFDATTQMNRLVEVPGDKLQRGLTTLGPGESWLIEPQQQGDDTRLWSPGVRDGVARGSEYHLTEYFGPILGVMTARNLDEAVEIVNEVDYGLTSGLHSLDQGEISTWLERIQAGNLYINRGTTGAIVRRQPFGGWKKSAVGPGAKAGGPNYLMGLGTWDTSQASQGSQANPTVDKFVTEIEPAISELDKLWLSRAVASDAQAWNQTFSAVTDVSDLKVERNVFRYCPMAEPVVIRFAAGASPAQLVRTVAAGLATKTPIAVSYDGDLDPAIVTGLANAGVSAAKEDLAAWGERLTNTPVERVRAIGTSVGEVLQQANGRPSLAVWAHSPTEAGRVELLPFVREQAVSITAHRFGTRNELAWSVLPTTSN